MSPCPGTLEYQDRSYTVHCLSVSVAGCRQKDLSHLRVELFVPIHSEELEDAAVAEDAAEARSLFGYSSYPFEFIYFSATPKSCFLRDSFVRLFAILCKTI